MGRPKRAEDADLPQGLTRVYERVADPDDPTQTVLQQRVNGQGEPGWRIRVRDHKSSGQKEKTFYGSRAAAEATLREFEATVNARTVSQDKRAKSITVEEFVRLWLPYYAYEVQPSERFEGKARPLSTWKKARSVANAYVVPMLGAKTRLRTVTTQDINDGIAGLTLKDAHDADGQPVPASGNTKKTVTGVTKAMFRDAVTMGLLDSNPAKSAYNNWEVISARANFIPSLSNIETLARALDKAWPLPKWAGDLYGPNGEGRGDMLRFIALTGLRISELFALMANRVYLDERFLEVEPTATQSGGRRQIKPRGKSKAATRPVIIVEQLVPVIERLDAIRRRGLVLEPYREARRQARGAKRGPNVPLEQRWKLLVPGEQGGYMDYSYWRKKLAKAQQECGITNITAHLGRHVAASLLLATDTLDPGQVQQVMGHGSIATTRKHYGHLFPATWKRTAQEASARIGELTADEMEAAVRRRAREAEEGAA